MSHSNSYQIIKRKQEVNKSAWEQSEFPIICETCLGENPFLRMTKESNGKECKVCSRPFTVFRWKPGPRARFKKTEICQVCSKSKNICQTCLLDLQYGLPVQVRDHALPKKADVPISDVNKEYQQEQIEKQLENGEINWGKVAPSQMLSKLARSQPYYKRNLPHLCSFFIKGDCNRGTECPYRHESPSEDTELANQKIKDRYHGVNDPVALRMLNKANPQNIPVSDDPDNSTLFVGGVVYPITEQDLRDKFYAFGEISSIQMVNKSNCAFITFTRKEDAENALKELFHALTIHDLSLSISWSKPKSQSQSLPPPSSSNSLASMIPMPSFNNNNNNNNNNYFPAPPQIGVPPPLLYYPSMDPMAMGSKGDRD